MRKLVGVLVAAVLAAGGAYYGLFVYPDQRFHAELEGALKLVPAGWLVTYQAAQYSLLSGQGWVTSIHVHGPVPQDLDLTIDEIEVTKPNLSLAADWAKSAADPTAVSKDLVLRTSERIAAKGVKYRAVTATPTAVINASESFDSISIVGLRLYPAALLQFNLKELLEAQATLMKQQQPPAQPPQFAQFQPFMKGIAGIILGLGYDRYETENIRVAVQVPAQPQVPALDIAYGVRKMVGESFDRGVMAGASVEGVTGQMMSAGGFALDRAAMAGWDIRKPLEQLLAGDAPAQRMLDDIKIGRIEYAGLSVPATPVGPITLGSFSMANISFAHGLPVSGEMAFNGFRLTREMMKDPNAAETFRGLGVDALTLSIAAAYRWDVDKHQVSIDNTSLKIDELGAFNLSADVAGVTESVAAANSASLAHAVLRYDDASLVDRMFKMSATQNNADPAAFRLQIMAVIEQQRAAFADKPAMLAIVNAVAAFLGTPHSLTVEFAPPAPISLAQLQALKGLAPPDVVTTLGITVAANK